MIKEQKEYNIRFFLHTILKRRKKTLYQIHTIVLFRVLYIYMSFGWSLDCLCNLIRKEK